jgi:Tol biopolymer transport system component
MPKDHHGKTGEAIMIRRSGNKAITMVLFLFLAVLAAGCDAYQAQPASTAVATLAPTMTRTTIWTPTFTLTSTLTPTPTQIPVQDRALSAIVLQKSEIPDFYSEDLAYLGPSCMQVKYPGMADVHKDLVTGFRQMFISYVDLSFYDSSIFVYPDEKQAKIAYRQIKSGWAGDIIDMPVIGSESSAAMLVDLDYGMYFLELVWREDAVVMELLTFAVRKPDAGEMVRLAQGIQRRLEVPSSPAERIASPIGGGSGQIAFISDGMIVRVNSDGSGRTCIVNHSVSSFSFSPDGRKIAFTSTTGGCRQVSEKKAVCEYDSEIYTINDDGTDLALFINPQSMNPVWSPDGKKILFTIFEKQPYQIWGIYFLASINSDGSDKRKISDYFAWKYDWSPDSEHIGFTCFENEKGDVCTMDPNGTNAVHLTGDPSFDMFIQWSPDGKQILYKSDQEGGEYGTYIMDANGGNPKKLIQKDESTSDERFSPDGKKILYVYRYFTNIFSINSDGSGDIQLTDHPGPDVCPIWSPDGEKIVYITQRNGPREIFLMNADGSDQKLLAWMGGEYDICPVWVPG